MARKTKGAAQEAAPAPQPQNGSGQRARPAYEARIGRLKVVAWRNESKEGYWYSFSLTRTYKDGQGPFKSASTLGRDDLLVACVLLTEAFKWVAGQTNGSSTAAQPGNGHGDSRDPLPDPPPAAEEPIP